MKKNELPKKIPIFPLSNFIIFPKTSVPLNIFEPRYIDMINDCMKSNKLIGMTQPMNLGSADKIRPDLYKVGCLGKITSFRETEDGRYLIELKGLIRFEITNELKTDKKYREFDVTFEKFFLASFIISFISPVLKYFVIKLPPTTSLLRAMSIAFSTRSCILKKSEVLLPLIFGDISDIIKSKGLLFSKILLNDSDVKSS